MSSSSKNKKKHNKNFNKVKIYKIIWRDAFTEPDEWHSPADLKGRDYICHTVGFLVKNNKKSNYYTIAATKTKDGYYCSIINIPKAMVISKTLLD